MNRKHLLLSTILLCISLTFACERLEVVPAKVGNFVNLDTAGRSTFILVDRSVKGAHRYIDPDGRPLFGGERFFQAFPFRFGYGVVSKVIHGEILYGVLDQSGKTVIPVQHPDPIFSYEGGLFKTGLERLGYLDTTGSLVIPMEYTGTHGVQEGLVTLKNEAGKWGILNLRGEPVAPFRYLDIGSWSDGLAAVSIVNGKSAKWGFINQGGEIVIPCVFDYATDFEQGVAMVKQGQKFGLIDAAGQAVTPFEFDDFQMAATSESKSEDGIQQPITKLRLFSSSGQISVSKGGKWVQVDLNGKITPSK